MRLRRVSSADMPNRSLPLSYLFLAEIKQAQIIDLVDWFGEIISDRQS